MLTGLWHGAGWNFVLWGLYYAVLLILEKTFLLKKLKKLPSAVGHIYTVLTFMFGWALFYFESLPELGSFLLRLFTPAAASAGGLRAVLCYLPLTAAACLASTPLAARIAANLRSTAVAKVVYPLILAVLALLCTAALASQSYNPFIYFRF